MKLAKIGAALAAAFTVAASVAAPTAHAMNMGNYDLLTNRYDRASWFWFTSLCVPEKSADCIYVSGDPRLKFYDNYDSKAYRVNGRWSFTVDVSDGVTCHGYGMPSRDTYSRDDVTLVGTIDSVYDVGCYNGPPGTQHWTFALQRL